MQIVNFKSSRKTAACTPGDVTRHGAALWSDAIKLLLVKVGTTILIQVYFSLNLLLLLHVPVRDYYQLFEHT
jgi:hypothetical protein